MTGKADFTAEEWELVREGPPTAGMMALTAEHGGTFRETWALAKAYAFALGIPVVTGAHADYWEAFRSVGIRDRIEGHGRLMLSLSKEPAPATAAPV